MELSDIPLLRPDPVQILDLSHNVIRTLRNESFPNYLRLSEVILSYNELEGIQLNAFAGLHMIRKIDLSYNNLKSIYPEIFSSNPKLEFLSLRSNPLKHLPSQSPFLVSNSVSSLDLSSCFLAKIYPLTFSRLPRLYSLDLSSNSLQTVPVRTLENLSYLKTLHLANNRWTCSCDVVELMQWASERRGYQSAHRPIKCLEGGKYRTLWTAAGGGISCSESTTLAPLVASHIAASLATSETTIDTATSLATSETTTDIAATLTRLPFSPKIASLHLAIETAVTDGDEPTATPEIETRDWDGLFSWNANTILVFLILPCTLGVAVFFALIAVNCVTKRWKIHRPPHTIKDKKNRLADFFSLDPQLTPYITNQSARYVNINKQGIPYDTYHIYEEID
jgi:hypothetical protein